MLEAFQSLRDELTTKIQEVDQTSASASKPGAVFLDPPALRPRTTSHVEEMEVDYGPALPPHSQNVSDQNSNASEEPSKKVLDRPKQHSHKRHEVEQRSALDQFYDESDESWMSSSKPKKNMLTRVDI